MHAVTNSENFKIKVVIKILVSFSSLQTLRLQGAQC